MLKTLAPLFGADVGRDAVRPLYAAIVAEARQPHWFLEGGVVDTREGRFEMVSAILALVLIRMEALGDVARAPSTALAEVFVEDMDGQLREEGVGDIVVGKHVGRMMGALGGRLGAYREAFDDRDLESRLRRNLYRGDAVSDVAVLHSAEMLRGFAQRLNTHDLDALLAAQF